MLLSPHPLPHKHIPIPHRFAPWAVPLAVDPSPLKDISVATAKGTVPVAHIIHVLACVGIALHVAVLAFPVTLAGQPGAVVRISLVIILAAGTLTGPVGPFALVRVAGVVDKGAEAVSKAGGGVDAATVCAEVKDEGFLVDDAG